MSRLFTIGVGLGLSPEPTHPAPKGYRWAKGSRWTIVPAVGKPEGHKGLMVVYAREVVDEALARAGDLALGPGAGLSEEEMRGAVEAASSQAVGKAQPPSGRGALIERLQTAPPEGIPHPKRLVPRRHPSLSAGTLDPPVPLEEIGPGTADQVLAVGEGGRPEWVNPPVLEHVCGQDGPLGDP